MILIILGPSGCGKGTQASVLAKKCGLAHVSSGDILRLEYDRHSKLGLEAYEYWIQGHWVPTAIVFPMLARKLRKYPQGGFILEGWPRDLEQKRLLDAFLRKSELRVDRVFYLDTPEDICWLRINDRIKTALKEGRSQRRDDREELIRERFMAYNKTIGPILAAYEGEGLVTIIDNRKSIEEVSAEMEGKLTRWV